MLVLAPKQGGRLKGAAGESSLRATLEHKRNMNEGACFTSSTQTSKGLQSNKNNLNQNRVHEFTTSATCPLGQELKGESGDTAEQACGQMEFGRAKDRGVHSPAGCSDSRDESIGDGQCRPRQLRSSPEGIASSESDTSPIISNASCNISSFNGSSSSSNNSNSNTNTNSSSSSSADSERRYRPQKYCAVCGDKAIACNFNAVTCESCKAFFRRNAFKEQRLKCLFENRCIIDRVTRRFCSKCRLLKCFQIGMKREWILTDEQKQIKRVKIMQNKQSRQPRPNTPNCANELLTPSSQLVKLNDCEKQANNGRSQAASKVNGSKTRPSRCRQLRVETRDAATSCPDELELLNPSARLIHYCSLAYQCQYCSLRLESCHVGQPMIERQQVRNQAQVGHEHQVMRMQYTQAGAASAQIAHISNYGHEQLPPASIPDLIQTRDLPQPQTNCCCSAESNEQHQAAQFAQTSAIQFARQTDNQMVQQQQQQVCTINEHGSQQLSQLHVMTPSEVAHMSESGGSSSMLSGPFSHQNNTTGTARAAVQSHLSSANEFAVGSSCHQINQTERNFNPFVVAFEVCPVHCLSGNQKGPDVADQSSDSQMESERTGKELQYLEQAERAKSDGSVTRDESMHLARSFEICA